jgi:hypothetical protein
MQGVTSVEKHQIKASKVFAIILILIGLGILVLAHIEGKIIGGVILILAIVILLRLKDKFIVVLNSSSDESQALNSTNEKFINDVINSLNDTMVYRG